MLENLKDPILENLSSIEHGFFTRQGGVSVGVYASLNCSFAGMDSPDNVRENRRRITTYFHQPYESLVTVENEHGNEVVVVKSLWHDSKQPIGDGMVTNQKNIILGTDTADCPSVLFADDKASVIGLCHAGWKGAKKGIIAQTLSKMVLLGAKTENICAAIGPCIAQASYEVSNEFYQLFLNENMDYQSLFIPSSKSEHFLFDLRQFVKNQLLALNLKHVSTNLIDTYSDEKRFFSYRRTTHRKETDFGGHFSCILLK